MMLGVFAEQDLLGLIVQIGWLAFIVFSIFYGQRLQMWTLLREVGGNLVRFKVIRDEGRSIAISRIKEIGKPEFDPTDRVDDFMEQRIILPIDMDPSGIVWKLEHILDVREVRFQDEMKIMAPNADETQLRNLEFMLGSAMVLHMIYKVVRHYYLLGKKTMNLYVVMQIQMVLPFLMKEAKSYASALRAFDLGQPIGDGVGALVAAKLMRGYEITGIEKDIVMAKVPLEGRTAYVLKTEGPGANLGKPGGAIKRIIEENNGEIASVITVDAGLRMEGEKRGKVIGGVGVAIGGPGIESFKVDESVLKHKIPVNAIIIKEDQTEAVSVMLKDLIDAVDVAVEKVKKLILEQTKIGDSVIIAGIGNTVGIGQ